MEVRLLLDSNAVSALRRGHPVVTAHVARAEEVLLSVIVAGELLAGFRSGSRYDDNLRALQVFVKDPNVKVLQITWNTAEIFGRIASDGPHGGAKRRREATLSPHNQNPPPEPSPAPPWGTGGGHPNRALPGGRKAR